MLDKNNNLTFKSLQRFEMLKAWIKRDASLTKIYYFVKLFKYIECFQLEISTEK